MPIFVNKIDKVIFITSPKAGYSTLWEIFEKYHDLNHDGRKFESTSAHFLSSINLKEYTDYKVLIILRNPYQRVISGFQNWIINIQSQKLNGHQDKELFEKHPYKNFSEFVDLLFKEKRKEIGGWMIQNNWHFTYQKIYCDELVNDLDYHKNVVYIDIKEICFFIDQYYGGKCEKKNVTKKDENFQETVFDWDIDDLHTRSSLPNYKLFYNSDILNKIKEIYDCDFLLCYKVGLNYSPPININHS